VRRKNSVIVSTDSALVVHSELGLLLSSVSEEMQEVKVGLASFLVLADDEFKNFSVS
jgi:hypothetical protein